MLSIVAFIVILMINKTVSTINSNIFQYSPCLLSQIISNILRSYEVFVNSAYFLYDYFILMYSIYDLWSV